jgi:hypothetical protein
MRQADDFGGDNVFMVYAKKNCPWLNPSNIMDENVQLTRTNSMCITEMFILCTPNFLSDTMNCHTSHIASSIWIEMDADAVEAVHVIGTRTIQAADIEVYGDKQSMKPVVGTFIADISSGSEVTEQPWCDSQASLRLVPWAPFVLFLILLYLIILGYYIYQGWNSIVPIPSTPIDGVKIAQNESHIIENNHQHTTERRVPELFGIKYNNDPEATNDYFGVTTVPQRYRRPLISSIIINR